MTNHENPHEVITSVERTIARDAELLERLGEQ